MTREEFLSKEIYVWGEDYIFDLLDRGYMLRLTSAGWKWVAPVQMPNPTKLALLS